jgi:predicted Fe-Mo cluster-binding NifX family protein
MRVAISTETDSGLEAAVSPHFGHCPFFTLVDLEGERVTSVRAIQNPYYAEHVPGAVPQFINEQGANVMLTGGMGYRAVTFFAQFGIQAVTGAGGTVSQALQQFLSGALTGAAPCAESVAHGEEQHAHQ